MAPQGGVSADPMAGVTAPGAGRHGSEGEPPTVPILTPGAGQPREGAAGSNRLPLGAALMRTADTSTEPAVVILASGAVTEAPGCRAVARLFEADPALAAVVPMVLGADGTLLEAGALRDTASGLRSRGAGDSPRRSEYRVVRAVSGTQLGCFAVRRRLVPELVVDPSVDDAAGLATMVLGQLDRLGHRIVVDPSWRVTCEAATDTAAADTRLEPARTTIVARSSHEDSGGTMVVCSDVSGLPSPWSDAGLNELIDSLAGTFDGGPVAVACSEGLHNAGAAARLRARGVDVETGPADWRSWFDRRAYRFARVVVTDGGLASGLMGPALASQPQAAKVLWTNALPDQIVESRLPLTPHRERDGHLHALDTVAARTSALLRSFDHVWAGTPMALRRAARSTRRDPVLLPRPARPVGFDRGFGQRWGVGVLAGPGADVVAGHEDAAALAADVIFPRLLTHEPDLRLVLVADRPSPGLVRLAARRGVQLVEAGADGGVGALAGTRVVLAPYRYGLGAGAALWAALCAGTPLVTTAFAAPGLARGNLAAPVVRGDALDLVDAARQLHLDAACWQAERDAFSELSEDVYGWSSFEAHLGAALLELGVRARPVAATRPAIARMTPAAPRAAGVGPTTTAGTEPAVLLAAGVGPPAGVPWRPVRPALRPADRPGRIPPSVPDGVDETDGYRLWCRTRGPTPAVLSDIAAEVATLEYRPTISVVTPVYNTDADVLQAAIDSVVHQLYGNWELCLADDNSTRPETKEVLARAARHPRVRLVTLPGQSGIAGASNAGVALAGGDYVTFLDHDDVLKPHALAQVARWLNADPGLDVIYSDEDKLDPAGQLVSPFFKPDWSPNLLTSTNYVCHLLVVRKSLLDKVGGFRSGFDGSQDHDLVLRLVEATDRISHIPEPLYSWRMVPGSAAAVPDAKPYAFEAAKKALGEALVRRGGTGSVVDGAITGVYRIRYAIPGTPRVAIIIPTRDRGDLLRRCITSIREKTTYANYEVVVIDNESRDPATLAYLATGPDRLVHYPAVFNYARMLNMAAAIVECDAFLFLNNDTEVIDGDWIEALLEHGMRPEVGAVGCRLYLADGRPQHEGIIVGAMGTATNVDHQGFWGLGEMTRDCSAITGACTMIRPSVYWAIGGNDERLRVAYNDVDICLRIRQAGYQVVYTPYARLIHVEGASRAGYEHAEDPSSFHARWREDEERDPYYNFNFDRHHLYRLAL